MVIRYEPEVDILYIKFKESNIEESDEIRPGLIIDFDSQGNPVGIEFLDASKIFAGIPEVKVELPVKIQLWIS